MLGGVIRMEVPLAGAFCLQDNDRTKLLCVPSVFPAHQSAQDLPLGGKPLGAELAGTAAIRNVLGLAVLPSLILRASGWNYSGDPSTSTEV